MFAINLGSLTAKTRVEIGYSSRPGKAERKISETFNRPGYLQSSEGRKEMAAIRKKYRLDREEGAYEIPDDLKHHLDKMISKEIIKMDMLSDEQKKKLHESIYEAILEGDSDQDLEEMTQDEISMVVTMVMKSVVTEMEVELKKFSGGMETFTIQPGSPIPDEVLAKMRHAHAAGNLTVPLDVVDVASKIVPESPSEPQEASQGTTLNLRKD